MCSTTNIRLQVDNNSFTVFTAISRNYAINEDYTFHLRIGSKSSLKAHNFIGKTASLYFIENGRSKQIRGVITKLSGPKRLQQQFLYGYKLIFHSPLHLLSLGRANRTYSNMNMREIVTCILKRHKWTQNDYRIISASKLIKSTTTFQYQQSDYDFLCKELSDAGLFYLFLDNQLVICDDLNLVAAKLKKPPLDLNYGTDYISDMCVHATVLPKRAQIRSYNHNTPDLLLTTSNATSGRVSGYGTHYLYTNNNADLEAVQQQSRSLLASLDCQRYFATAITPRLDLYPGQLLNVSHHPIERFNGKYYIYAVNVRAHRSMQSSKLTLIPLSQPYKSRKIHNHSHQVPLLGTKVIEQIDSNCLDTKGNYSVALKCANIEQNNHTMNNVRLSQLHTGTNHGIHFPLATNSESLLLMPDHSKHSCILIGAAANCEQKTSNNELNNYLQSKGKSGMTLNEELNSSHVELYTAEKLNRISIKSTANNENLIKLGSRDGELNFKSNLDTLLAAKQSMTLRANNDYGIIVGINITINVLDRTIIKSLNQISLSANDSCTISAQNNLNIYSRKCRIYSEQQDMTINGYAVEIDALNSSIFAEGKRVTITSTHAHTIKTSNNSAKIEIDQSGNVIITAAYINIKALTNI